MAASWAFPGRLVFACRVLFLLMSSQTARASLLLCPTAANNADSDACGRFPIISDIACSPTQCDLGFAYSPGFIVVVGTVSGDSFPGGDPITPISDPDACCSACAADPACDAWSYDTYGRRCYITSSNFCSYSGYRSADVLNTGQKNPNTGTSIAYYGSKPTNPRCQAPSKSCPGALQAKCVASPITLLATADCAAPAPAIGQINAGSLASDGTRAQIDQLSLTFSNGTSFSSLGLGDHSVRLTVADISTAQSSCDVTVTVIDNELAFDSNLLNCFGSHTGTVTTITPTEASLNSPAVFSASYTKQNGCSASVLVTPGSVTCTRCNKPGQKQNPGCIVSIEGATVSIANSGGLRNHMTWGVSVTSPAGPLGKGVCGVCIEQPSGQKEVCKQWVPGGRVPGC